MTLLKIFGVVFCVWAVLTIVVPYLMRRSELLTAWNLFIAGAMNFIGIASIQSGSGVDRGPSFVPSSLSFSQEVYTDFVMGAVVFFLVLALTYYYARWPRRAAARRFQRWPVTQTQTLTMTACTAMIVSVLCLAGRMVPGLSAVTPDIGEKLSLIAVILSFVVWLEQPANPAAAGMVGLSLLVSLLTIFAQGSTRRMLLSVILGIAICAYWYRLRHGSRGKALAILGSGAVCAVLILGAYNTIRHGTQHEGESGMKKAMSRIAMLLGATAKAETDAGTMLGGDTTDVSLTAIDVYAVKDELPTEPFFTIRYIVSNPIPRSFWSGKPEALGSSLPEYKGQNRFGTSNWGPGIVGHGYHEGGLHMLVFYGVLFGLFLRYLDELLMLQGRNPYFLAVLGSFSGQLPALSRGDIGVFSVQIIVTIVIGLTFMRCVRFFSGTDHWVAPSPQAEGLPTL